MGSTGPRMAVVLILGRVGSRALRSIRVPQEERHVDNDTVACADWKGSPGTWSRTGKCPQQETARQELEGWGRLSWCRKV
eukprot:758079-Hanusia_phi.AAC.2